MQERDEAQQMAVADNEQRDSEVVKQLETLTVNLENREEGISSIKAQHQEVKESLSGRLEQVKRQVQARRIRK